MTEVTREYTRGAPRSAPVVRPGIYRNSGICPDELPSRCTPLPLTPRELRVHRALDFDRARPLEVMCLVQVGSDHRDLQAGRHLPPYPHVRCCTRRPTRP